ncbi:hypothetical protein SAMN04487982_114137 [Streptomyces sp. ok210]|nr:hypothetical protein SAMN04487982_114137 [Streptomyces sp. ok210]
MQSLPMQSPATEGFLTCLPEPVRRSLRKSLGGRLQKDLRGGVPGPDFCPISTCRAGAGKSAGLAEGPAPPLPDRPVARCGPSTGAARTDLPRGHPRALTCVMTDGRATWARSYYRDTTGDELRSVLTLMGPGGRTVETRCTVESQDEPRDCEMPHCSSCGGLEECVAGGRACGWRRVARQGGRGGSADAEVRIRSSALRGGLTPDPQSLCPVPCVAPCAVSGHENARSLATGDAPATGLLER